MTRKDSALVLALVACLAIVAVLVGAPAFQPVATPAPTDPPVAVAVDRPYREGVLGHPESISPLTARSQADRDLVALLFAGLVRNGPNGSVVPVGIVISRYPGAVSVVETPAARSECRGVSAASDAVVPHAPPASAAPSVRISSRFMCTAYVVRPGTSVPF